MAASPSPQRLIFSQHGWSDTGHHLGTLVRSIAPSTSEVVAPSLDYWKTWLRMEPLIQQKEAIAAAKLERYPDLPLRVVGHSMGGLIWIELLQRHPEWLDRLESLILVGSPVGGSDIARMIDPLGWGIGIARDLGVNRRSLASDLAQQIPTLVIASDIGGGTDGIVPVECTKVPGAAFELLPNIHHSTQRVHSRVGQTIQQFWQSLDEPSFSKLQWDQQVADAIAQLQTIPGITDATYRDLPHARLYAHLGHGLALYTWRNPLGLQHVFLTQQSSPQQPLQCLYAGYVGWFHNSPFHQTLLQLKHRYASDAPCP